MNKIKIGFLFLSGISTIFAIGVRYLLGTEGTGDVLFWLFVLAIGSLIVSVTQK